MAILRPFGNQPVIVKDFVKSRKHEWYEACYIPVATDGEAVERVVRRFIELQGEALNEGLVFREFVEFEPLATHAKSGMPLTKEYRLFVLDGQIILTVPYGSRESITLSKTLFHHWQLLARLRKRFRVASLLWMWRSVWMEAGWLLKSH